MSPLSELKQSKVFRVAAAFAIVAWLSIEVISVVLAALRLPERNGHTGHGFLLHDQFVRVTLGWYDQHLGPTH